MNAILNVLFQSLFAFFILFVISKLLGKKQVAQLEFSDYVVGISIGSIAAQMAIDPNVPWFHFVIAMGIFFVFDLGITLVSRKSKLLKKFFKGKPLIIINQGKIDYRNLKKSKLDINELVSQCRVKGYFDLSEINYCIFETSGDFSILAKSDNTSVVKEDLNIKQEDKPLHISFVVDGEIDKKQMTEFGKDTDWLLRKTKLKSTRQIKKNILLFSYNPQNDSFEIFEK